MRIHDCVIDLVIAGVVCLVGCSRNPVPDKARDMGSTKMVPEETRRTVSLESVVVPVTNIICTAMAFKRTSPPPWEAGNALSFRWRRVPKNRAGEQRAEWVVINMHADNFGEITRRLKMSSVKVHVLHTGEFRAKVQETGRPERIEIIDQGYAVVTDTRIPRKWFLSEPGRTSLDKKTGAEIRAAYPESFRAPD